MSTHLTARGLTVEQVRRDAMKYINHFGGQKMAAEALGVSISAFHVLFAKDAYVGPGLLQRIERDIDEATGMLVTIRTAAESLAP
ncbi:MAG: hypothetical protein WDA25_01135 [Paracoccaceae bacterium]